MVREMAGDGPEDDAASEDGASSGEEDVGMDQSPEHDTPGSTPSTGKPYLAVPPPPSSMVPHSVSATNGVPPPPPAKPIYTTNDASQ